MSNTALNISSTIRLNSNLDLGDKRLGTRSCRDDVPGRKGAFFIRINRLTLRSSGEQVRDVAFNYELDDLEHFRNKVWSMPAAPDKVEVVLHTPSP